MGRVGKQLVGLASDFVRLTVLLVGGDVFAEAEEVAVGVAEDEFVHLPVALGERREDGGSGGTELGFEGGCGSSGEVEVDAGGILILDEQVGFAEVKLEGVAGEEGVLVAALIALGGEAEELVEGDGAGEVFDGEDGDDAED